MMVTYVVVVKLTIAGVIISTYIAALGVTKIGCVVVRTTGEIESNELQYGVGVESAKTALRAPVVSHATEFVGTGPGIPDTQYLYAVRIHWFIGRASPLTLLRLGDSSKGHRYWDSMLGTDRK